MLLFQVVISTCQHYNIMGKDHGLLFLFLKGGWIYLASCHGYAVFGINNLRN